jgi:hypothetical protein
LIPHQQAGQYKQANRALDNGFTKTFVYGPLGKHHRKGGIGIGVKFISCGAVANKNG